MARKLRYFEKMGMRARAELVRAISNLCYDAMVFGYEKAHVVSKSKGARHVWTDRTGALADSFACAVYIDGVLDTSTIRYIHDTPRESLPNGKQYRRANRWTSQSGREYVNDWLRRQHPGKGLNEVRGIVVAAMPYALWLEKGTYALGFRGSAGESVSSNTTSSGNVSLSAFRIPVISSARTYINANYDAYTAEIYKRWGIPKYSIKVAKGPEATYFTKDY